MILLKYFIYPTRILLFGRVSANPSTPPMQYRKMEISMTVILYSHLRGSTYIREVDISLTYLLQFVLSALL